MKPEEEYRVKIDQFFEKYFNIDREVWSTEKRRIDYVLQCKESGSLFGVEVKHENHMRGIGMGEYLLQAHDYSKMKWKTKFTDYPTKLLIFITPAISNTVKQVIVESKILLDRSGDYKDAYSGLREHYMVRHESTHEHSNINSWIAAFGIGEIRCYDPNYFAFMFNNKPIWRSYKKNRTHPKFYNFYNSKLNQ